MSGGAEPRTRWFVMSAIGEDRPGIVADLAELIYDCDCNLEDSRMTKLGTAFATLVLASGRGEAVAERLASACKRLEWEKRLTVFVREVSGPAVVATAGRRYACTATGVDKAGIVATIARHLADEGANVIDLHSTLRPASGSGTPIYTLHMELVVPEAVSEARIRERLDAAAAALGVDVVLDAVRE
jgi:glycine cleavage system transcriptional repressor